MTEPPRELSDMYALVHEGIDAVDHGDDYALGQLARLEAEIPGWLKRHREMEHTFPSPSGVMRCRLQQWHDARGEEPDQETPLGWKIRRAMGVLAEPYWLAVLGTGGAKLELPNARYPCGPHMWAHPDARMDGKFLVELKSETGVGYKILLETAGGVEMAEKAHYVQAQLYMYATGDEWTLYLTYPPDPALLQSDMRRYRKYGQHYILPPVYLEWIRRDEPTIEMALARAEMIAADKLENSPPQKEYSGVEFRNNGRRAWPCGYCMHLDKCNRGAPLRGGDDAEIAFV